MGNTCAICGDGEPSFDGATKKNSNTDRRRGQYNESDEEVPSRSVDSVEDELIKAPLREMIASGDTAAFVELEEDPPLDPTLGGIINWPKLSDFAAMLPVNAKRKLWKGVFRTGYDEEAPESTQIKRVLKVFVKLFLTTVTPIRFSILCCQLYTNMFPHKNTFTISHQTTPSLNPQ